MRGEDESESRMYCQINGILCTVQLKCEILTPLKMPCTHRAPAAQSLASGNFSAGRTA